MIHILIAMIIGCNTIDVGDQIITFPEMNYKPKSQLLEHSPVEKSYNVTGQTLPEVGESMSNSGIKDPNDGETMYALTNAWFAVDLDASTCQLHKLHVGTDVTLPNYIGSNDSIGERFNAFRGSLRDHEMLHVGLALRYGDMMIESMTDALGTYDTGEHAADCRDQVRVVESIRDQILEGFPRDNSMIDSRTQHGQLTGACWDC